MHNQCDHCARPAGDTAYACRACADRARRQLHTIADTAAAARDVAHGLSRSGPAVHGGGGDRIPVNLGATARLDAVTNAITTWARHVANERGDTLPATGDPLEVAARYLAGKLDWLRFRQEGPDALTDIAAAERVITGIVDPRADRRWLGQCGADLDDHQRCTAELHAPVGATTATCRACGTRHPVADRRAFLDGQTRDQAYTARQISQAYPQIPEGTIRSWAKRGELVAELEPLPDGVEGPLWVHRDAGGRPRPRYVLGDVLALAARKAAARAEREARRARHDEPTDPEGQAA